MDTEIRDLERKAALGDEAARERLWALKKRTWTPLQWAEEAAYVAHHRVWNAFEEARAVYLSESGKRRLSKETREAIEEIVELTRSRHDRECVECAEEDAWLEERVRANRIRERIEEDARWARVPRAISWDDVEEARDQADGTSRERTISMTRRSASAPSTLSTWRRRITPSPDPTDTPSPTPAPAPTAPAETSGSRSSEPRPSVSSPATPARRGSSSVLTWRCPMDDIAKNRGDVVRPMDLEVTS